MGSSDENMHTIIMFLGRLMTMVFYYKHFAAFHFVIKHNKMYALIRALSNLA